MNKEKEIERMAKVLCDSPNRDCNTCHTYLHGRLRENCEYISFANKFISMGYGNVKQAVKEFAEKLKEEYCYVDKNDGICMGAFPDEIDNLITELYGEDE